MYNYNHKIIGMNHNLSGRLYQIISPGEFLHLLRTNKGAIKNTRFIAPRLGSNHLGKIFVEYNYEPATQTKPTASSAIRAGRY